MQTVEKIEQQRGGDQAEQQTTAASIHVRSSPPLDVLDDDALYLVGDVVEGVDALFQMVIDFAAAHEFQGVAGLRALIKLAQTLIINLVGPSLDAPDLLADLGQLPGMLS